MHAEHTPEPDYGFIMNNGPAPKKSLLPNPKSKTGRIVLVAGGGIILLLVLIIVFGLIFGRSGANTERLVGIAASQTELIRVAEIGEKQASAADTKNFATTVKYSLTSARTELTTLLGQEGRKISGKELSAGKDTDADAALTAATQANRFDESFTELIREGLEDYQNDVRQAFTAAGTRNEKQVLQSLYNQARVLTAHGEE